MARPISKEEIARNIKGHSLIIENANYKISAYTAGGEGITFECVGPPPNWFSKLYNKDDCSRKQRFEKMEELSCIPFRYIYLPKERVKQLLSFLKPVIKDKLEDMILMQAVPYASWENYKNEKAGFGGNDRYKYAFAISKAIESLEKKQIAHRDVSHSNVLINATNKDIVFIDWDQTYHSDMPAPERLKRGTPCYKPTFRTEYGPHGDRFALAIMIIEFLYVTTKTDSPFFENDELVEAHKSQRLTKKILRNKGVFQSKEEQELQNLAIQTMTATSLCRMPMPTEWIDSLQKAYSYLGSIPIVLQTIKLPQRKISTIPILPIRRSSLKIKQLSYKLTKNRSFRR